MNTIFYVEHDAVHHSGFVFDVPEGHDCWLLVITKTAAQFWVDGELKEYPPHHAVLYAPHQKIYYRACAEQYVNDWIRLHSDEPYITESRLPRGKPFPLDDPEYCHKLFQLLVAEHSFKKDYQEASMDFLLRTLFNKMLESCVLENIGPQHYPLMKLRTAIHNNPGYPWTVAAMAKTMSISPGYLQLIYKKSFGVSCMDDVIHSRIRLAKEYLRHYLYSIAEIADRCGYRNVEHFCRQFKQITGVSPKRFKQQSVKVLTDRANLDQ
ncbi:hypothetical protein GCM10008014_17100 [Paenibacillus silvae]|uniref:HTH araC/xylS-type domain-containing protein n=1 Tax=Paenibacillus silvae TaxID=1325358 RepID=A0ABQ1Z925_9BACL|nr:AraC family transcriptional regulator [Paenibacillus silvae]GGH51396.1 hypothetical protein GCM10008014_17100 [Paenibacillus silvae]